MKTQLYLSFLLSLVSLQTLNAQNRFSQLPVNREQLSQDQSLSELVPFREGNQWSFVNRTGETTIEVTQSYDVVYPFDHGLAMTYKDSCYGFIDETGNEVIPCQFEEVHDVQYYQNNQHLLRIRKPKPIDKNRFRTWRDKCWLWKGYNRSKQTLTEDYYEFPIKSISNGPKRFSTIIEYSNGFVKLGEQWLFLNKQMEPHSTDLYDEVFILENGFIAKKEGKARLLSNSGELIEDFDFEVQEFVKDFCWKITQNGKVGLMNRKAEITIPIVCDSLLFDGYHRNIRFYRDGELGRADKFGTIIVDLITNPINNIVEPEKPNVGSGPVNQVGPAGPQGPAGATGPTGGTGSVGRTGTSRPRSSSGSRPIGPVGPVGATGPAGPQGPMAPDGVGISPGPFLDIPAIGSSGASGPAGPQSATGPLSTEQRLLIEERAKVFDNFKMQFDEFIPWVYFLVRDGEQWYSYSKERKLIRALPYESVKNFGKNLDLGIKINGKWGAVDRYGEQTLEAIYDTIFQQQSSYFVVGEGDKVGLVNANNQLIVPMNYQELSISVAGPNRKCYAFNSEKGKGLIRGTEMIEPLYNSVALLPENYGDNLVLVSQNGKYGFVDWNGRVYFKD